MGGQHIMYEKQTLPNGVRIVYEHMPHVRSAAIGVWVGVGSRYESPCEAGSAHFIEHMLFKGTAQHSASELAERMDAIGGQVNAYTTREGTCYYARVLDEHLDRAGDLLAEMLFTSNFSETDADNERGVIREEMDMYADTPEDLVTERLIGAAFPGALGRPVLGRPATIDRLTGARLRSFQIAHYIAPRIVIAVSGSFTDENIARLAAHFSWLPVRPDLTMRSGSYTPAFTLKRKAIEQNQISIGFLHLLEGFAQKGVLGHHQFHIALEALAAQGSGLLGVERLDVGDVEVRISLELLGEVVDYNQFFFLSHLFSPPSYLVSTDLESICTPGLMVVER